MSFELNGDDVCLIAILNDKSGSTKDELTEDVPFNKSILSSKINKMRERGYVVKKDGKFHIKPKAFNEAREKLREGISRQIYFLDLLGEFGGYSAKEYFEGE